MHRTIGFWLLGAAFLAAGCEHNHYVIEIRPDGDQFARTLTCWRSRTQDNHTTRVEFPEGELDRIALAYSSAKHHQPDHTHVFTGTFARQTPQDVGGSGGYARWASSLGDAFSYSERFRGSDDIQGALEERKKAVDLLADLLVEWFAQELGEEPNFPALREYLDHDVRRDFLNLTHFWWLARSDEDSAQEVGMRAVQYLRERGYLSATDVPLILRGIQDSDSSLWFALLRRPVADKLRLPDDQSEKLAFLADTAAARKSWEKFIQSSPAYKKWVDEKQAARGNAGPWEPKPSDMTGDLFATALGLDDLSDFLAPSDELEVRLETPTAPHVTNGQWNADQKRVDWKRTLHQGERLPSYCYAIWAVPNAEAQQARFGKVALFGKTMSQYAIWYAGLSDEERDAWDKFLAGVEPGPKLRASLEEFRFPSPKAGADGKSNADHAGVARQLILEGLDAP